MENPFKWRHYESEIILLCVRWYLRYTLSYRDLEEMMSERGLSVVHTTIYRWVQAYAPEIDRRCRSYLKKTSDSWRVDETYVKVRGKWMYLYRALVYWLLHLSSWSHWDSPAWRTSLCPTGSGFGWPYSGNVALMG